MSLNKEQMRLYQRDRRARQRERGGIEGVIRAKDVEHSAPHLKSIKGDIPAFQECDIESGAIDSMVKPILPVPVLAEPETLQCKSIGQGEARESTTVNNREADSRGGQDLSDKIKAKLKEHKEDQRKAFEDMAFTGLQITPPIEEQHTKTDQLFENKKPGYYIFEKEVIEKKCWYCGESFETRLRLNRFCCPDHKERWLTMSFRMGKE